MIPLLFAIHDVIIVPNWAPAQDREKNGSTITNESFMRHFFNAFFFFFLHGFICQIFTGDMFYSLISFILQPQLSQLKTNKQKNSP